MSAPAVRFPHVSVRLAGEDGNAFSIVTRVSHALRRAGADNEDIKAFTEEAMSGDYDHLLKTVMQTVAVR